MRELIFAVAAKTKGVGKLEEVLRWQQPSFITISRSGSLIRIDRIKNSASLYGIFFLCQTSFVATFWELYGAEFVFQGNRCIILDSHKTFDPKKLEHCIALALTYHQKPSAQLERIAKKRISI